VKVLTQRKDEIAQPSPLRLVKHAATGTLVTSNSRNLDSRWAGNLVLTVVYQEIKMRRTKAKVRSLQTPSCRLPVSRASADQVSNDA